MRSALMCTAIAVLSVLPAAAQTDAANDLPKPIERCIRDNAAAVERAIDRLPDAVDFLVNDLCAKPIAEQQAAEQKANMTKLEDAWKSCQPRKPASKSNAQPDETSRACTTHAELVDYSATGWTIYSSNKPPEATSLAAKILLDLRTQRMNATSTQGTR
jgi:L-lactate utilization protein LutC